MTINQITYQIRGAVYDVYKTLGPGLLESVYEEALVFELQQRGLRVEQQKQVPIIDKGNTRQPVAVHQVAVSLNVVLTTGEVPEEIAPVHPVTLVVDKELQVFPLRRHGDGAALTVVRGFLSLVRANVG